MSDEILKKKGTSEPRSEAAALKGWIIFLAVLLIITDAALLLMWSILDELDDTIYQNRAVSCQLLAKEGEELLDSCFHPETLLYFDPGSSVNGR